MELCVRLILLLLLNVNVIKRQDKACDKRCVLRAYDATLLMMGSMAKEITFCDD